MHRRFALTLAALAAFVAGGALFAPNSARACGCFSPAPPPVPNAPYSVTQSAEQILFEVNGDGTTTAHVLIQYEGDPATFAWVLPTMGVPELGLSPESVFAVVDASTQPDLRVQLEDICPVQEFQCNYGGSCGSVGGGGAGCAGGDDSPTFGGPRGVADLGSAPAFDAGVIGGGGPVMVLDRQIVGDYDVIVFGAGDAEAAVTWLGDNGFLVSPDAAPYMQPYADAGMNFLAARLLPGAGVDAIKPLRMTYTGPPMIPLELTAVSAEPELTVTAFVFGAETYVPRDQPVITPDERDLSVVTGRFNYPALLSRSIDEAGGAAFVAEHADALNLGVASSNFCCQSDDDPCGIGFDGSCQCPLADFDQLDCGWDPETGDALPSEILNRLASYTAVTRLTTRLNPEEMNYDPVFVPGEVSAVSLTANDVRVRRCERDAVEPAELEEAQRLDACADVYCGHGECGVDAFGDAGCVCDEGFVARHFVDLDGTPTLTCVPRTPIIDYKAATTVVLRDACEGVTCGQGACFDVGGTATCRCDEGTLALRTTAAAPICAALAASSGGAGATNPTDALHAVEFCRPAAPDCGPNGWLTERNSPTGRRGQICASTTPAPERFEPVECPEEDGGCSASPLTSTRGVWILTLGVLAFSVCRRRERLV